MNAILETTFSVIRTHFSTIVFFTNILLSLIIIFRERKSTSSTWSWLFVVNLLPIFGFILYILIGRGISSFRIFKLEKQIGRAHV